MSFESACNNLSQFKALLERQRSLDNKITNVLNKCVQTESFESKVHNDSNRNKCLRLKDDLDTARKSRINLITNCIEFRHAHILSLNDKVANDEENAPMLGRLMSELKLIKEELYVEEILKSRTMTAFYERCREFL
ncbi:hypothetical protein GJ496_003283 [Pomphorhynchus laevis]|nr:hypothetical protein GJ496_003283 [Pomphorhynchus laevis]